MRVHRSQLQGDKAPQFLESEAGIGEIRLLLCGGAPQVAVYRKTLWAKLLDINNQTDTKNDKAKSLSFSELCERVANWELCCDVLTLSDLHATLDMPDYFVFENQVAQTVLCFSHDESIAERTPLRVTTAPLTAPLIRAPSQQPCHVPPSGVIAFHSMCTLVAPLCYVFGENTRDIYRCFRELYVEYFCRLHLISTCRDSILRLCLQFEEIAYHCASSAYTHCISHGVHPTQIVFPWIFSAFAGVLRPAQTLRVWDLCLGFDSLQPLVALAAAIFSAHETLALQCSDDASLKAVFSDLTMIDIDVLLCAFLDTVTGYNAFALNGSNGAHESQETPEE
ncbi:MAG: hypothetical protein MHM6MM_002746 [Cercozoa sp. M6MM]